MVNTFKAVIHVSEDAQKRRNEVITIKCSVFFPLVFYTNLALFHVNLHLRDNVGQSIRHFSFFCLLLIQP